MKKELKMLCMAMIASILTTGFCACSNDDDDNETNGGVGKGHWVLTKIESVSPNCSTNKVFSYDTQGRVISDTDDKRSYEYQADRIIASDGEVMFLNKDGLIERMEKDATSSLIKYQDGYIFSFYDGESATEGTFTWNGGLCTSFKPLYDRGIRTLTYRDNSYVNEDCIKILNARTISYDGLDGYWAMMMTGYLGKLPSQLVTTQQNSTFELYDIDDNGCPGTMITHSNYGDTKYILSWKKI